MCAALRRGRADHVGVALRACEVPLVMQGRFALLQAGEAQVSPCQSSPNMRRCVPLNVKAGGLKAAAAAVGAGFRRPQSTSFCCAAF